jgi:hypothetical protein
LHYQWPLPPTIAQRIAQIIPIKTLKCVPIIAAQILPQAIIIVQLIAPPNQAIKTKLALYIVQKNNIS